MLIPTDIHFLVKNFYKKTRQATDTWIDVKLNRQVMNISGTNDWQNWKPWSEGSSLIEPMSVFISLT